MTVAVIRFGGSNCDRDTVLAFEDLGIDASLVWYEDGLPEDVDGIVLPGGFSYGDYLRAGAMAANTAIMDDVREAANRGIPVLGICNGAQIGCEAGLTPGAFTTNRSARFQCEHVHLRIETTDSPWTAGYEVGDVIRLPIAHGEGRFELPTDAVADLEAEDRILCRYCDADGNVTDAANPNGSVDNIAGVLGTERHVAVLMPHPERACVPFTAGSDGRAMLTGVAPRAEIDA